MKIKNPLLTAALGLFAVAASAQVSPYNLQTITNVPAVLANGTPIPATNIFLLTRNCALAVDIRFTGSNVLNNVTVGGSFSIDTTNFGLDPFVITSTTNAGAIIVATNWDHPAIAGFTAVNFTSFTNGAAASPVTNTAAKLNRPTLQTQTF